MSAVYSPTEPSLRRDLVAVRHPQVRHPVQRLASHQQLRGLSFKAARADALTKDHLHAKDSRLGQRAPMVVALALPLRAPRAADGPQVLITEMAFGFRVTVLPDARPFARRDRRPRLSPANRFITVTTVVGPVGADLLDPALDLIEQVLKQLRVLEPVGRHHRGHYLARGLVHAEVEFAPRPAARVPVLSHLPLALAIDLDAGRVNDQVQRFRLPKTRQLDLQRAAATAQGRVTGHAQLEAEQTQERARQPCGGAQRQAVHLCQRRHAQDSRVGVGGRLAAPSRALMAMPLLDHIVAHPQRQTSALDQSFVILTPVTETVLLLGFLAFHTSRLPGLLSP